MSETLSETSERVPAVLVTLGENLYRRRVLHLPKITQPKLAELSGVSINTIAVLEAQRDPARIGKPNYPQLDTVERLAVALGCKVAALLEDEPTRVKRGGNPLGSPRQLELIPGEGTDNQPIQSPLTRVH